MLPHFLDNRFTDGGEVVSLTNRQPFTPQEDSWYSFLLEVESTLRAKVRLERLGKLKNPPHRDSNPLPSGLWHSASTNYANAYPHLFSMCIRF
jgi:hypothetical protein